ncbi:ANR family transcriptional regulator [Actinobacillus porcinus]|uniref:ANR family transcriptional regulator n=1 Tax=Actinobacillus porcinus TaxID=51048 RepID=UPI002A91EEBB|nr:ANR family transcriptional regulator [Actinobacillus porcinus]MDY5420549.1 ANR family transcriptional regulator [Actinobacillus porcinus]
MQLSATEIAHNRKMTYLNFAKRAVKLEQEGKLADAAQAWQSAKNQAASKTDESWCEYRKTLCHRWKGRVSHAADSE